MNECAAHLVPVRFRRAPRSERGRGNRAVSALRHSLLVLALFKRKRRSTRRKCLSGPLRGPRVRRVRAKWTDEGGIAKRSHPRRANVRACHPDGRRVSAPRKRSVAANQALSFGRAFFVPAKKAWKTAMASGLRLEVAIRQGRGAASRAGHGVPHPSRRFALQSSSGIRDDRGAAPSSAQAVQGSRVRPVWAQAAQSSREAATYAKRRPSS